MSDVKTLTEESTAAIAITDALIKQCAAMSASGASKKDIAKQFGLSNYFVNKIFSDELFKKSLGDIGDEAILSARAITKRELARLASAAVKTIAKNLEKHNLQAAQTVLKAIGLDGSNKDDQPQGGFTLVLANQKKEEVIKVVDKEDE